MPAQLSSSPSPAASPDAISEQYIRRVSQLPPAPTILVKLLNYFKNENHDLDEIVGLFSHDPALAAEVLRRCNSAFFAGAEPVGRLSEAVCRLGLHELYRIVATSVASRTLALVKATRGLQAAAFWKHSLLTAQAATVIALRLGQDQALAFTSGLLHDTGKLILAAAEPSQYTRLLVQPEPSGSSFPQAEYWLMGVDHATLGARLFQQWHLPPSLVEAVRGHHQLPSDSEFRPQAAVIQLADMLARHLAPEPGRALNLRADTRPSLAALGWPAQTLDSLLSELTESLDGFSRLEPRP